MTAREVDAVIVGGGHNGLVAAAYLGRAGLRVLVCGSGPSPATVCSRARLAVLACLQAADGRQPAEPVIRDFVTFAAQLLGQRD